MLNVLIAFVAGCLLTLEVLAAETISLATYLDRANQQGLRILYASNLVPRRFRILVEPGDSIAMPQVERALGTFNLGLSETSPGVYAVTQLERPASLTGLVGGRQDISPALPDLEEVVVSSSRHQLLVNQSGSYTGLSADELARRPTIGNDVGRIANQLPGSATVGLSAKPRVRGGKEDETLISFDGVTLYDPFHFKHYNNLFSTFDSRLLSSIDFYSGGFPVSLGDRLSAAMVIETKQTEAIAPVREVGLGLYNLSYLQGWTSGDDSALLLVRRSNFEILEGLVESDLGTPNFGDLFARYGHQLDNGDEIQLNLLWFADNISLNNSSFTEYSDSHYVNTYLWVNWAHALSDAVFVRSIAGFYVIKNDRTGRISKPDQATGMLDDDRAFQVFNLKQDYDLFTDGGALLTIGWDYRYIDASYDFVSALQIDPVFQNLSNLAHPGSLALNVTESGHQGALYANWKQQFSIGLTVEAGVRVDLQHYGHALGDEQVSARVGLLYAFKPGTEIRLGFGRYVQAQGIHELNINDGEAGFQDKQVADQLIVSLTQNLGQHVRLRVEAYLKDAKKAAPYFQNLGNPLTLIPELQVDRYRIEPDGYIAKGWELSLASQTGSVFDWWLNYSYATVKDQLPGRNIRRSWDQQGTFNGGFSLTWDRWTFSLASAFHEGWLTTPLSLEGGLVIAGPRNSERFEHYSSLDVKVSRSWDYKKGTLRLDAGLTNLLDEKNQLGVDYALVVGALVKSAQLSLPMAPFLDVYWQF